MTYTNASHQIYFKNLDGLRLVSFLGVFFSHTIFIHTPPNKLLNFLIFFFKANYYGVPFFFTLSSFLITYNLLTQKKRYGTIKILSFYKNRALRIWPLYFFILIIFYCIFPLVAHFLKLQSPTTPSIVSFIFFYVNFFIIKHGSFFTLGLAILWSISIEEQFYFCWAIIIKFILIKYFKTLLLMLFIFSITFSCYYLYSAHNLANNLAIHSIFILQNFCTGAFIGYIVVNDVVLQQKLNLLPKAFFVSIYFILPALCFVIVNPILLNVIKVVCFALIIFDQTFYSKRIFNLGQINFINYLGKISYGLYLYHALVIVILHGKFNFFMPQQSNLIILNQVFIALVLTITIAHFSYKYIELYFLRKKSFNLLVP